MDINTHWSEIRSVTRSALQSSLHCAIASIDNEGLPHNTPIGSLILNDDCSGYYFEQFTRGMPERFKTNKNVSILLVNSGFRYWMRSLLTGNFPKPGAIRLTGVVGERREATEQEKQRWLRRVSSLRWTKGHELLWSKMRYVRDIEFTGMETISAGSMTKNHWKA